jgi:ABC-type polysaccharide/polyol phosphate export permease
MYMLILICLWTMFTAKVHMDDPSMDMASAFLMGLFPAFVITAALAGASDILNVFNPSRG